MATPRYAAYATPPTSPYAPGSYMSPAPATPHSMRSPQHAYPSPVSPQQQQQFAAALAPSQYFPHCKWDVTQSPTQACTPQRQPFAPYLSQPCSNTPLPSCTLHLHIGLPAPQQVLVVASDGRSVSINDVLAAIHSTVLAPVNPRLWSDLSPPKQQRVAALAAGHPLRIVHLLEGATHFSAIRASSTKPATFDITFSR